MHTITCLTGSSEWQTAMLTSLPYCECHRKRAFITWQTFNLMFWPVKRFKLHLSCSVCRQEVKVQDRSKHFTSFHTKLQVFMLLYCKPLTTSTEKAILCRMGHWNGKSYNVVPEAKTKIWLKCCYGKNEIEENKKKIEKCNKYHNPRPRLKLHVSPIWCYDSCFCQH